MKTKTHTKSTPLQPVHLQRAREALEKNLSQLESQYPEIFLRDGANNKKIFDVVYIMLNLLKPKKDDHSKKPDLDLEKLLFNLFCDVINKEKFGMREAVTWAVWNAIKHVWRFNTLKTKLESTNADLKRYMDTFNNEGMKSLDLGEDPGFYVSATQFLLINSLYFVASLLDPIDSKTKDQTRRVKFIEGVPDYHDEKALEAYIGQHFLRRPLELVSNTLFMLMSDPVSYCSKMLEGEGEKSGLDTEWLKDFEPMAQPVLDYHGMLKAFKEAELQWLNQCEGKVPYWLGLAKDGNAADIQQALTELSALQDRAEQYKIGSVGQLVSAYCDRSFPENYLILFKDTKLPDLVAMPDEKDKTVLTFVPFKAALEERLAAVRSGFKSRRIQLANIITQLQKKLGELHPEDDPLLGLNPTQNMEAEQAARSQSVLPQTPPSQPVPLSSAQSKAVAPAQHQTMADDVNAMKKALRSLIGKGVKVGSGALRDTEERLGSSVKNRKTQLDPMSVTSQSAPQTEVQPSATEEGFVWGKQCQPDTLGPERLLSVWAKIVSNNCYYNNNQKQYYYDNESPDTRWAYATLLAGLEQSRDVADEEVKPAWRRKILFLIFEDGLGFNSLGFYELDPTNEYYNPAKVMSHPDFEPSPFVSFEDFRKKNGTELDEYNLTLIKVLRERIQKMRREAFFLDPAQSTSEFSEYVPDPNQNVIELAKARQVCLEILKLLPKEKLHDWDETNTPLPLSEASIVQRAAQLEGLWPFQDLKRKLQSLYAGRCRPIQENNWQSILAYPVAEERSVGGEALKTAEDLNRQLNKHDYKILRGMLHNPESDLMRLRAMLDQQKNDPFKLLEMLDKQRWRIECLAVLEDSLSHLERNVAPQLVATQCASDLVNCAIPNAMEEAAAKLPVRHESAPIPPPHQDASPLLTELATQPDTQPESKAPPLDKTKAREALARIAIAQSDAYLKARHQRFWLRDAIASLFAWLFTPEQTKREQYLDDLNRKLLDYAAAGDKTSTATVLATINQGIKQFHGQVMSPIFLTALKAEIEDFERPEEKDISIDAMRAAFFKKESESCFKAASTHAWFTLFHPKQCQALEKLSRKEETSTLKQAMDAYNEPYPHDLVFKPLMDVFLKQ
jgi:hypothetical protein